MLSIIGKFLLLIVAFHVSFVATVQEAPAVAPLTKIKVGYPSPSASMDPLFVTREVGLFEKHGLDADLIYVQACRWCKFIARDNSILRPPEEFPGRTRKKRFHKKIWQ